MRYVDPDGRDHGLKHIGLGTKVLKVKPTEMTKEQARIWIRDNIILDDSLPVCRIIYRLGIIDYEGEYDFSNNEIITKALASAKSYANKNTIKQVKDGKSSPNSTKLGTTAFDPWNDTDLFGAFGGGCGYTWNVISVDTKKKIAKVQIYLIDTFDFNEGNGERTEIAEKLTELGRKAELSNFTIKGFYYIEVKVSKEAAKKLKESLENVQ